MNPARGGDGLPVTPFDYFASWYAWIIEALTTPDTAIIFTAWVIAGALLLRAFTKRGQRNR